MQQFYLSKFSHLSATDFKIWKVWYKNFIVTWSYLNSFQRRCTRGTVSQCIILIKYDQSISTWIGNIETANCCLTLSATRHIKYRNMWKILSISCIINTCCTNILSVTLSSLCFLTSFHIQNDKRVEGSLMFPTNILQVYLICIQHCQLSDKDSPSSLWHSVTSRANVVMHQ